MSDRVYHLTIDLMGVAKIPRKKRKPTSVAGVDLSGTKHVPDQLLRDLDDRELAHSGFQHSRG